MGCNCGGRRKSPTPASAGVATVNDGDPRPHVWRVEFPNGAHQDSPQEWQARAIQASWGGYQPRKVYLDE